MKIITEPKVYIVGRQVCDHGAWGQFLIDTEQFWECDTERPAEMLTEGAGRLCYLSFSKPRPGGNAAYLQHIKESAHGSVLEHAVWNLLFTGISRSLCFRPDTEILTREGWKLVSEIADGEQLLTKCPQTGVCRWSTNKRLLTMQHDGPVHWFENSEWSSPAITPDHLVWCTEYDRRRCRDMKCRDMMDKFGEKIPYRMIHGKRFVVDHEIRTVGADDESIEVGGKKYPSEEFFEWLGWCLTDGGASKHRKACYVTQTKSNGWSRISFLMNFLFPGRWRIQHDESTGHKVARIHDADLWEFVVNKFGRLKPDRRLTWLFGYSRRLVAAFLRGALGGDGSIHAENGHTVLYCSSKITAGDYQVLFAMSGQSACVRIAAQAGRSHTINGGTAFTSTKPERLVSVHKNTASLVKSENQKMQWYSGLVHCPETDDGLVYVRRRGHGVWSGNTHELVRHRAGMAYSMLSQRYVDESVAEYVEPDIIAADPDLHAIWLDAVEHVHSAYVKLAEALNAKLADPQAAAAAAAMLPPDADRTTRRKAARQAARSVLPNATETKIFVTANARALRTVIEQRCSRHAEPEIRKLFGKVWELLAKEAPNLFGDYTRVPLPDGTFELTTSFKKV